MFTAECEGKKKDKKAIAEVEGKKTVLKNTWKVVGSQENKNIVPGKEKVVGDSSKSRRESILEAIRKCRAANDRAPTRVWFVSLDRGVYESCMGAYGDATSEAMSPEDEEQVGDGSAPSFAEGVEAHVQSKGKYSKQHESWFEITEEESDGEVQEHVELAEL